MESLTRNSRCIRNSYRENARTTNLKFTSKSNFYLFLVHTCIIHIYMSLIYFILAVPWYSLRTFRTISTHLLSVITDKDVTATRDTVYDVYIANIIHTYIYIRHYTSLTINMSNTAIKGHGYSRSDHTSCIRFVARAIEPLIKHNSRPILSTLFFLWNPTNIC